MENLIGNPTIMKGFGILILFFIAFASPTQAQREVKTYFNAYKTAPQEIYHVMEDGETLQGNYIRFYSNGNKALEGSFKDGERDGTFLEYYENGKLSCRKHYQNGRLQGPVEVFDKRGKPLQTGGFKSNRLADSVKSFFPSGKVQMASLFVNGKPDGVIKEYFPSGKLRKEMTYKNSKPNGIARTYYENSALETEANYTDGFITHYFKTYYHNTQKELLYILSEKNRPGNFKFYDSLDHLLLEGHFLAGRLHGENIGYYEDGKFRHRYHYRNGLKTGTNVEYYPNQQVKVEEKITGIASTVKSYSEDGIPVFEKRYKAGKPTGFWKYYAADGKNYVLTETYVDGRLHGLRTQYYPNGQPSLVETWQYDLITGAVKNYYEDGTLSSEGLYRANRRHGLYTAYYPTKKIKEQGTYVSNSKHKEWKFYDESGNLIKTQEFNAGRLVKEY